VQAPVFFTLAAFTETGALPMKLSQLLLTTSLCAVTALPVYAQGRSFSSIDTDNDGRLSLTELTDAFGSNVAQRILGRDDDDEDGYLTRREVRSSDDEDDDEEDDDDDEDDDDEEDDSDESDESDEDDEEDSDDSDESDDSDDGEDDE
jgi:hypothetical protein